MNVVFRADASLQIGSGHVMRCLTLANELRSHGCDTVFACRHLLPSMEALILRHGHSLTMLRRPALAFDVEQPTQHAAWLGTSSLADAEECREAFAMANMPPDWVVVDHYALGAPWEQAVRQGSIQILAIDDLADRGHDCDCLLDQNLYVNAADRYVGLVAPGCMTLLGPKFALLRPEFRQAAQASRHRSGEVRRLFVFFGGSDPGNETNKALNALESLDVPLERVDVVVGAENPHRENIAARCESMRGVAFHCQVTCIANLMAQADLAVSAGGTNTWERCALGLPAVVVSLADNQVEIARGVHEAKAQRYLGPSQTVSAEAIAGAIAELQSNPALVASMSRAARDLVDFDGSRRVRLAMECRK